VNPNKLREQYPVSSVPLEAHLGVGSTGVSVVDGIGLDSESTPFVGLTVPQLEEPDRNIALLQFDESGPDLVAGREGDEGRMAVLGLKVSRGLHLLPLGPALDHHPVDTVNVRLIQMGSLQTNPSINREGHVGIQVNTPGSGSNLMKPSVDKTPLR
jgi:hypothetical protein